MKNQKQPFTSAEKIAAENFNKLSYVKPTIFVKRGSKWVPNVLQWHF